MLDIDYPFIVKVEAKLPLLENDGKRHQSLTNALIMRKVKYWGRANALANRVLSCIGRRGRGVASESNPIRYSKTNWEHPIPVRRTEYGAVLLG